MTEPEDNLDNLRLIHDEISARSNRLDANGARLDSKATTLLGFVLAAATFLAAHDSPIGWKVAAFAAMSIAGGLGIAAMRPRKHQDAPEPGPLWNHMKARQESVTLALLIAAKVEAFEKNQKIHELKATQWRRSLVALTLAVTLTVTALAIGTKDHGGSGSAHVSKSAFPYAGPAK